MSKLSILVLKDVEITYLYNSGAGRPYPFVTE